MVLKPYCTTALACLFLFAESRQQSVLRSCQIAVVGESKKSIQAISSQLLNVHMEEEQVVLQYAVCVKHKETA